MKAVDFYTEDQELTTAYPYKKPSATSLILKRESSGSCSSDNCNNISCNNTSNSSVFGKTRYKLWALVVIVVLAFWSMFTGSVTLNWSSAGALADDFGSPLHSDLDILEVEEREKVVRHMWDVYTHSKTVHLPKFWQRAFEAAYEDLISDVPSVRNAAVSEIAKMSLLSLDLILESLTQSTTASDTDRTPVKETRSSKLQKSRRRLLRFQE
ncbi:Lanosterol synthase [Heracleum sosnowskyi]|uniref:Lanosterol synthase n=1 Tax=Heracleum sosnowskyi TaxID=360622 RepID=A0AAD8N0J8_9APIA|nr:Lanosterol synthase [Heracleum sosnowskyi]